MNSGDRTAHLRGEAARALDAAMRGTRTTNSALGDACGVDEKRVRRWRSDDTADLDAAPPVTALLGCSWETFELAVEQLRRARVAVHGPSTTKSRAQLGYALVAAKAKTIAVISDAASDGVIEPREEPAIEDALAEEGARASEFVAALRKRGAR